MEPRLFSFNFPLGACSECKGLGVKQEVDLSYLIQDDNKSVMDGGIFYYKNIIDSENIEWKELVLLCKLYNIDMNKPLKKFSKNELNIILNGSPDIHKYVLETRSGNKMNRFGQIEGVKKRIERLYSETSSQMMRDIYGYYMGEVTCPHCNGDRLNEQALSVLVGTLNIQDLTKLSIKDILTYINNLNLTPNQQEISKLILKEISNRLTFLLDAWLREP